jgi:hypothetical protein
MARRDPTIPQHITIAQLAKRGFSYAQIAKAVGVSPDQVRESLTTARQLLEAHAGKFAADYIAASHIASAKGDHRPAREMLDRLHVTDPTPPLPPDDPNGIRRGGVTVNIGFAMPGVPRPGGQLVGVTVTAGAAHPVPSVRELEAPEAPIDGSVEPPTLSPVRVEVESERGQE